MPEETHHRAANLKSLFESALDRYPDRIAVRIDGTDVTYRDLDKRANAVAHALVDRGVEAEDRVGLMTANRLEYLIADLAIVKAGAVKVPLNDMLTAEEFEYMLSDSRAETVVCGPSFIETLDDIRSSLDALDHPIAIRHRAERELPEGFEAFDALDGPTAAPPERTPEPGDVGGHYYTGGTTGKPKGAIHTQEGLAMAMYAHSIELGITGDDTMLLMTPLPHSAGAFLWAGLLTGATAVIHDGFEPTQALESIDDHDVTWTFMVPTMIYRLLDHPELDAYETGSLETLAYGAAPMTPARLEEGIETFGPIFLQFYGQTEVPNVITTLGKAEHQSAIDADHEERLSSAGHPTLMAAVKIVDIETGESVAPGEEGEIAVTAPFAMREYFERPEKTAETIKDGWVLTGDVGTLNEDGYVYLLDRESDVIITGGMNVYSTKVEEAVAQHPEVAEVAVIGIPDNEWGEAVHAVVVPAEDGTLTEDELVAFAEERLADYKQPKSIEFVAEIPKTPYGKHDKVALRDHHWEEKERNIA